MIELTDEMRQAYEKAAAAEWGWITARSSSAGLAAVLALVGRDHEVLLDAVLELLDTEPNHKVRSYIRQEIQRYRSAT